MFLKNHAESKVFQNNKHPQAFCVKIWCQVGKLGYNSHRRTQSFRSFDQALTSPSGVQRRIYTTSAEREFEGVVWGRVGGTEDQKCPSNFFILCEYIGNVYTYIYLCSKFVTNFVIGLKIWSQVGVFGFYFQNHKFTMIF